MKLVKKSETRKPSGAKRALGELQTLIEPLAQLAPASFKKLPHMRLPKGVRPALAIYAKRHNISYTTMADPKDDSFMLVFRRG